MNLADRIQDLDELELATLVCLVASQHCIVDADQIDSLDEAQHELQAITLNLFGLSCAVVNCTGDLSVDDFSNAILINSKDEDGSEHAPSRGFDEPSYFSADAGRTTFKRTSHSAGRLSTSLLDSRRVADVVIAKNLNLAHHHVQVQALELIRGKRIFTRTAVHAAPKRFLFIALVSSQVGGVLLNHLNDQFCLSHSFDTSSLPDTSYIGKGSHRLSFSQDELDELQSLAASVRVTAEVRGYLHNVLTFLRAHRAVAGGVSATATRHLNVLVRYGHQALAPLHALTFVPPSLVALATRKVYTHRIILIEPDDERSLQWGSNVEAVKELLENVTVQDVIEDVLRTVEVPL
ncbi:hypothetical protein EV356DRAFT_528878 [Viridothelium virens]|uniref:Magnesium chelatase n=1 Tax=Viridothelium virens TaxID=1048519 RepID=A0A6A6HLH4_VIRVR|nr:hypothetical protein EV356DRAFT_528878 [Viridothelium virens]